MRSKRRVPAAIPTNRVLVGDCIEELRKLPSDSVDLVFADPPYNLQLDGDLLRPNNTRVDGVDDDWDKFSTFAAYDHFSRAWLTECRRILKPDGAIWVIGSYHNIFRLGVALQDLGFWIQNDIVWRKVNPMPNFRGKRFTNAHETLIWAGRDQKSRVTFNYESLKAAQRRHADAVRLAVPDLRGPGTPEGRRRPQGASDAEAGSPARTASCSPPPIPATSCSIPFFGTGTTGAVAQAARPPLDRHRARPDYATAAQRTHRRRSRRCRTRALETVRSKRAEPRVPFGTIIELGMLTPGSPLFDERRRVRAEVKADGTVACRPAGLDPSRRRRGQGKAACNGWTFWHFEREGKLTSIDTLRETAKERLGLTASAATRSEILVEAAE